MTTTGPDLGRGPGSGPPRGRGRSRAWRDELREEGAKPALIAAASTVTLLVVVVVLIGRSESWPRVQRQFFNGEDFRESFPDVLGGFWLNLQMWVVAEVLILALALLIAVIRSLRGPAFFPLRALAVIFIDLFRGAPLLLVIILFGFGIPALDISWVPNGAYFWGVTALVLSYAAYTAEVYRAGIDSVHESQRAAARSIGLTQWQTMRYAVLPQAVRNVVPALLNGLVSLQKDVALVSVLGVREAVREAEIYTARTFNYTSFVAATVLFLVASVPLARFADWYTARDRARRSQNAT
ncbi:MAG: amino acid ABC transporter permease [Actinomycetota bacterium]